LRCARFSWADHGWGFKRGNSEKVNFE